MYLNAVHGGDKPVSIISWTAHPRAYQSNQIIHAADADGMHN